MQKQFGAEVPGWTPPPRPEGAVLAGRYARLERLDAAHADDLHRAFRVEDGLWDYLAYGPFPDASAYRDWVTGVQSGDDPLFYTIIDRGTGRCGGVASYLRIMPESGSIEIGHICLAPEIQRGRVATEALYLMMRWAFEAGYRRVEWKCDALNAPSRRAAGRLGFVYEGLFRQATVVKGRNRDTAWYAVIDGDWPRLRAAYDAWLAPENFTPEGRQIAALSDLTQPAAGGIA